METALRSAGLGRAQRDGACACQTGRRLDAYRQTAGVGRVDTLASCTYAHPDRFFSYRRTTHAGEADYGRQISALVLL